MNNETHQVKIFYQTSELNDWMKLNSSQIKVVDIKMTDGDRFGQTFMVHYVELENEQQLNG